MANPSSFYSYFYADRKGTFIAHGGYLNPAIGYRNRFRFFALPIENCPDDLQEQGKKIHGHVVFYSFPPHETILKNYGYETGDLKDKDPLFFKDVMVGTFGEGGNYQLYVLQPKPKEGSERGALLGVSEGLSCGERKE